jgi:ATP-binding cassette subfamily F protein 3
MATLLQISQAVKSYGDQVLLDGAEATLSDDVHVGFVGRNGAGKSTLLRVLLGEEELDSGEIIRHPSLRLAYLRQHDPFHPGETLPECNGNELVFLRVARAYSEGVLWIRLRSK